MKRLCIIPCGAKKIWDVDPLKGATKACYVYRSPFHIACQKYATVFFSDWVILSAKHGFLFPDDLVLANYDVAFGTKKDDIITAEALRHQLKEKEIKDYQEIIVLGGKKYRKVISEVFDESYHVTYPLSGCKGIGYMLQRLNKAVESKEEIK
ncbi:DUF6884 domain-containing protein [Domibacillus mangrovi]|uniref:DUF6884 domain-containing protein n=1 Tax=Domibacillus mangrovi TaxID=1714354 RepID=A0A1Q5NZJ3_9BACI|nr:DUF6884 domain-containing protein [Domibacillus mangrovi]OKL35440.1 hypothetical protein BLL40_15445 [Domibacillus mangrovi]